MNSVQLLSHCHSAINTGAGEANSLTTNHRSSGRSGLFGPPLCGGSAPATPPLLQPPPHRVCGNMTLATRGGQAYPRVLAGTEYVPAQARQARQLPYMPNVHRDDHRQPATEILTVYSLQTDRTQCTHRTWLSSYNSVTLGLRPLGHSTSQFPPDCCNSFATRPVQPVWWLAPKPEPLSPLKYS